jgi:multimeric flavodoxin WrbA
MNLVAIMGSPRKNGATAKLVDRAIEGVCDRVPDAEVKLVHLIDLDLRHCRNCLTCRDTKTEPGVDFAPCVIDDEMTALLPSIAAADLLLLATPVHMASATGLMTMFLERLCWTFAAPLGSILFIGGIPEPRAARKRRLATIVTSGSIPPLLRFACDDATGQMKELGDIALRAKHVGGLYAGAVATRGVERYLPKAFDLGRKLAG